MFMSMFSHFEVSQGQKWSFSWGLNPSKGLTPKPNKEEPSSSASQESKTTRKDQSPPSSSAPGGAKQNPTRFRPRFAPELDGINCFESIVPC